MMRWVRMLAGLAVCLSTPAFAGDLGMAGALSGAGNAMGQSLQQMQSLMMQQELMRQQAEAQRQRDEQAERWQRERDDRAAQAHDQAVQAQQQRERAAQAQQVAVRDLAQLTRTNPDWRTVLASEPYRQWLRTQPVSYQRLIEQNWNPLLIGASIDQFQLSTLPSLPVFMEAARKDNPNVSDDDLRAYWHKEYGAKGAWIGK